MDITGQKSQLQACQGVHSAQSQTSSVVSSTATLLFSSSCDLSCLSSSAAHVSDTASAHLLWHNMLHSAAQQTSHDVGRRFNVTKIQNSLEH